MNKFVRTLMILVLALTTTSVALAHPGGTDSQGGHTDHSTGDYHYHHGYSAHEHYDMDGDGNLDCPYDFRDNADRESGSSGGSSVSYVVNVDPTPTPTPRISPEPEPQPTSTIQRPKLVAILVVLGEFFVIFLTIFLLTLLIARWSDSLGCLVSLILSIGFAVLSPNLLAFIQIDVGSRSFFDFIQTIGLLGSFACSFLGV